MSKSERSSKPESRRIISGLPLLGFLSSFVLRHSSFLLALLSGLGTAQAAQCTYSLFPSAASMASAGGISNLTVTTGTGCAWSASTANPWLHTSSSGTGNGTVNYTVDANASTGARAGTITIGG